MESVVLRCHILLPQALSLELAVEDAGNTLVRLGTSRLVVDRNLQEDMAVELKWKCMLELAANLASGLRQEDVTGKGLRCHVLLPEA